MWGTTHLTLQHYWLCFNFNPSSRMGTTHWQYGCSQPWNISIHVPIAGNNEMPWEYVNAGGISIHVPIAGNDKADGGLADGEEISIHVPIAGNDLIVLLDRLHDRIFQSTFPLQGTTLRLTNYSPSGKHFNPRSHCREPPADADSLLEYGTFQSTFPLQGTTVITYSAIRPRSDFNPRSHCRERRQLFNHNFFIFIISIHVPIAGNDYGNIQFFPTRCISIHVPIAGNDRIRLVIQIAGALFQSTFPLQGTTDQLFIFS